MASETGILQGPAPREWYPEEPAPPTDFRPVQSRRGRRYRGSGVTGQPVVRQRDAVSRVPSPRRPESASERAQGWAWELGWELARSLNNDAADDVGMLVGRLLQQADSAQLRKNLSAIVSPTRLDLTVERAHRSYGRYYLEAFRAADMDPNWLHAVTTTNGFDHLDGALDEGNGAIVLLAHHGSWDVAARWAETHGYHMAVVAEVLRPRRVFRKFVALREQIGLEVIPLRRGWNATGRLREVLAANHLVGLLSDRDLARTGETVSLFGKQAQIPSGAVKLSAQTGAPIVPITMLQQPHNRFHLQVLSAFSTAGMSTREGAQRVAHALEDLIRLAPEQWHAYQPIFDEDRHQT